MKKGFLIGMLMSMCVLFSCHKTDTAVLPTQPTVPAGNLILSRNSIQLDTTAGTTDTIRLHTDVAWTASVPVASWIHINTLAGNAGDAILTITSVSGAAAGPLSIRFQQANQTNGSTADLTITPFSITRMRQKSLGGVSADEGFSSALAGDGGSFIAGLTSSANGDVHGSHNASPVAPDMWVVRLNNTGDTLWERALGGSGFDVATSITKTGDGGCVVAGWTSSNDGDITINHGASDILLIRLDAQGNTVWKKTIGGSNVEKANAVVATPDNGFIVTGSTKSSDFDLAGITSLGNTDLLVAKVDANGAIQWIKTYGGSGDDEALVIITAIGNTYLLTGSTTSNDHDVTGAKGNNDMWALRLDANGDKIWSKVYGGTNIDIATAAAQTTDGGFAIAGYSNSLDGDVQGNHGSSDCVIVKLDVNGNKLWAKSLGGSSDDQANSIVALPDGGMVMAGYVNSNDGDVTGNHGDNDTWIVRLDAAGNKKWARAFGGFGAETSNSILLTTPDTIQLTGSSSNNDHDVAGNHGSFDIWVLTVLLQ